MKHRVEATRCEGWWALDFPDAPGVHSQVRTLEDAAEMAVSAYEDGLGLAVTVDEIEILQMTDLDGNPLTR